MSPTVIAVLVLAYCALVGVIVIGFRRAATSRALESCLIDLLDQIHKAHSKHRWRRAPVAGPGRRRTGLACGERGDPSRRGGGGMTIRVFTDDQRTRALGRLTALKPDWTPKPGTVVDPTPVAVPVVLVTPAALVAERRQRSRQAKAMAKHRARLAALRKSAPEVAA